MPKASVLLVISAVLFAAFVFFSYLVHEDVFTQFDFNTTVRLQDNIPQRLDPVFSWLSVVGSFEILCIILGVFFLLTRKFLAGFIAFFSFFIFHVIEIFGKLYVNHPPPPQFMLRTQYPLDFPQFHVRAEFAYPSGHAGRTAFLASLFILMILESNLSKPVKLLLVGSIGGFAFAMFLSRPYLGEHWATDVIGGVLLGVSLGIFSGIFLAKGFSFKNLTAKLKKST